MTNANQRFVDVIFALKIADDYHEEMGRLQLQKYIYLVDIIAIVWSVMAPKNGHETYKHGPYDFAINNAADALAFRGLVEIRSIRLEEKRVDVQYAINSFGLDLFKAFDSNSFFENKISLYTEIGKHINKVGWKKLRELVYNEPTYLQSRGTGYGYKFDYGSLFSNESVRILYQFEQMLEKDQKLSRENMVAIFFKLIEL